MEDNTTAVLEEDQELENLEEVEEVEEQVADDQTDEEIVESAEEEEPEGATEEEETEGYDISLGDESLTSEDVEEEEPSEGMANLRKAYRELKQKFKKLEAKEPEVDDVVDEEIPTLGEKPTLKEHGYDEESHQEALDKWYEKKQKIAELQAKQEEKLRVAQERAQASLDAYSKSKKRFTPPDYREVEERVAEKLSLNTQNDLLDFLSDDENSSHIIYAIGKGKGVLDKLSSIEKDPRKFYAEIGAIKTKLRATPRKKPSTAPEGKVQTNGRKDGGDSTLKKLEAEALKTGNMNKLLAYEKKLAQRKRKT